MPAALTLPTIDHDNRNQHGIDCDLCWVLSLLNFAAFPLLIYVLLTDRTHKRLGRTYEHRLAGALAIEPYRARAPPYTISS
ncbi:MAG TPA: hypothetical protein P5114_05535 [Hyphomicrobiaceae bacterium]|nr:hypothetical protein [Hyphomicrobiaceae bacterium]